MFNLSDSPRALGGRVLQYTVALKNPHVETIKDKISNFELE